MLARGMEKLVCRERHRLGAEDSACGVDERDDEDDLERVDDVVADLRGGDVEAEDKGDGKAEYGGAAEDWIDADEKAGCDAPGELFGRGSHAKQGEDGQGDAAVEPVVMDGSVALGGVVAIWFDGLHFQQDRLR